MKRLMKRVVKNLGIALICASLLLSTSVPVFAADKYAGQWFSSEWNNFIKWGIIDNAIFNPNDPCPRDLMAHLIAQRTGMTAGGINVSYSDTKRNRYKKDIKIVSSRGIFSGYPNGSFGVDKPILRQEMASCCMRWKYGIDRPTVPSNVHDFKDVPSNKWAYDDVMLSRYDGTFVGYPGNLFGWDRQITVAEAIVVVERIASSGYKVGNVIVEPLPDNQIGNSDIMPLPNNGTQTGDSSIMPLPGNQGGNQDNQEIQQVSLHNLQVNPTVPFPGQKLVISYQLTNPNNNDLPTVKANINGVESDTFNVYAPTNAGTYTVTVSAKVSNLPPVKLSKQITVKEPVEPAPGNQSGNDDIIPLPNQDDQEIQQVSLSNLQVNPTTCFPGQKLVIYYQLSNPNANDLPTVKANINGVESDTFNVYAPTNAGTYTVTVSAKVGNLPPVKLSKQITVKNPIEAAPTVTTTSGNGNSGTMELPNIPPVPIAIPEPEPEPAPSSSTGTSDLMPLPPR